MWKPADLRLDFIQMKSGGLDNVSLKDLRDLIEYHGKEVDKLRDKMSVELFKECDNILGHLYAYYDFQEEKAKQDLEAEKPKKAKKKADTEKLTPTELYKAHYGENPSQAFRKQFDSFNKTEYARWLREQTRTLRHSGNN